MDISLTYGESGLCLFRLERLVRQAALVACPSMMNMFPWLIRLLMWVGKKKFRIKCHLFLEVRMFNGTLIGHYHVVLFAAINYH